SNIFHMFFAAASGFENTRKGFYEYWNDGSLWQSQLWDSNKTYSTLTSVLAAKDSSGDVYTVATQKSGGKYKIIYEQLK
ncbi:unnamed protein product, partial [marine sediment metagenome]